MTVKKEKQTPMTKFILCAVLLVGAGLSCLAQETKTIATPTEKKKIELKPNSRDYGAVYRNNKQERVERQRNQKMYVNKRPAKLNDKKKQVQKAAVREQKQIRKREVRMQRRPQTIQRRFRR